MPPSPLFPFSTYMQSPDYLYIGCADSRVSIQKMTGLDLGNFFIHRNIANMVVSSDLNLLAVLTYAVNVLKVKHILVTGHYDCGGIRASVQKQDYGQVLDAWLLNIRDVYRLHKTELDAITDEEARHRRLVELNVSEQCINLYKTSVVQRRRLEVYRDPTEPVTYPRVHGLVFDPATGRLAKIPIDYRRNMKDLHETYDLFDVNEYESPYLLQKTGKKE
jgi:carbonic anhydrase